MALNIFEAKEFHAASVQGGKHDFASERNRHLSWHQRKAVAGRCDVPGNGVTDRSLMVLSSPAELWESDSLSLHICCGYKQLRIIPAFSSDTNSFSIFIKKKQLNPMAFILQNDRSIHPHDHIAMNSSNFWTSDGLFPPPLQRVTLCKACSHRKQTAGN